VSVPEKVPLTLVPLHLGFTDARGQAHVLVTGAKSGKTRPSVPAPLAGALQRFLAGVAVQNRCQPAAAGGDGRTAWERPR
jgi:hypothetical protein